MQFFNMWCTHKMLINYKYKYMYMQKSHQQQKQQNLCVHGHLVNGKRVRGRRWQEEKGKVWRVEEWGQERSASLPLEMETLEKCVLSLYMYIYTVHVHTHVHLYIVHLHTCTNIREAPMISIHVHNRSLYVQCTCTATEINLCLNQSPFVDVYTI